MCYPTITVAVVAPPPLKNPTSKLRGWETASGSVYIRQARFTSLSACWRPHPTLDIGEWGPHADPGAPPSSSCHWAIRAAVSTGFDQRSTGDSVVGMRLHLKRWPVSCAWVLQSGQSGDGCVFGDILCRYVCSSGDLFVRNCASVLLMWYMSVCSDL